MLLRFRFHPFRKQCVIRVYGVRLVAVALSANLFLTAASAQKPLSINPPDRPAPPVTQPRATDNIFIGGRNPTDNGVFTIGTPRNNNTAPNRGEAEPAGREGAVIVERPTPTNTPTIEAARPDALIGPPGRPPAVPLILANWMGIIQAPTIPTSMQGVAVGQVLNFLGPTSPTVPTSVQSRFN